MESICWQTSVLPWLPALLPLSIVMWMWSTSIIERSGYRNLCFWCKGYYWFPDLDSWQKMTYLSHRDEDTLHECGPCPLLAHWLQWTFDPLMGLLVVPYHCWHFFSFGITGLVQLTSPVPIVLETSLSCFWLSWPFAIWQWFTFYCKSHLTMG